MHVSTVAINDRLVVIVEIPRGGNVVRSSPRVLVAIQPVVGCPFVSRIRLLSSLDVVRKPIYFRHHDQSLTRSPRARESGLLRTRFVETGPHTLSNPRSVLAPVPHLAVFTGLSALDGPR